MWNNLSLHVPIWVGIFVIGFKFGGGDFSSPEPEEYIEPTVEQVQIAETIVQEDLEWQRCGQYGLDYWEDESNGFYDCRKRN